MLECKARSLRFWRSQEWCEELGRSWGPGRSEGSCPTLKTILKSYKLQMTSIITLTSSILLYLWQSKLSEVCLVKPTLSVSFDVDHKCNSMALCQSNNVTIWQCNNVSLWECDRKYESVAIWQLNNWTVWQ